MYPKTGIHKHVCKAIQNLGPFDEKVALDFPAGDGRSSALLMDRKAKVRPFDLFPEFFTVDSLDCEQADINKGLPLKELSVDFAICQEGLEHFQDQLSALQEFSRTLKHDGQLLLTTPNISHLRGRLSQFFVESEYYKRSPESELDSVWFANEDDDKMYFGHIFLINIQKLRTLGVFSGLEIQKLYWTDISPTSALLFLFFYPFILFFNLLPFIFYYKKNKNVAPKIKRKIMLTQFKLNCSPKILLSKHTMVLFKKVRTLKETSAYLRSLQRTGEPPV